MWGFQDHFVPLPPGRWNTHRHRTPHFLPSTRRDSAPRSRGSGLLLHGSRCHTGKPDSVVSMACFARGMVMAAASFSVVLAVCPGRPRRSCNALSCQSTWAQYDRRVRSCRLCVLIRYSRFGVPRAHRRRCSKTKTVRPTVMRSPGRNRDRVVGRWFSRIFVSARVLSIS